MVDYASEHFKAEERLLREHAHPELQQQQTEHRTFRKKAAEFCLLAEKEDDKMVNDLLNFLHHWWTNHILVEDKKYSSIMKQV